MAAPSNNDAFPFHIHSLRLLSPQREPLPCDTMKRNSDDASRGGTRPGERLGKLCATITIDERTKVRLLFFMYRFSTGCLVPQMSLFMRSSGMSPGTIGRLQAIRPLVTLLCAPFW